MQYIADIGRYILDWLADVAWPLAVLVIALMYRRPIYALLGNIGDIAGRAANESTEITLGNLQIAFGEVVRHEKPKNVDEAVEVLAPAASMYTKVSLLPEYHRSLLISIAENGDKGFKFNAIGDPPEKTKAAMDLKNMGLLVEDSEDPNRFCAHSIIRYWVESRRLLETSSSTR